jgi:hypothetical protein
MGGSDAEGIQRGERAELHQLSFEPDRFANASEAVKRNNACIRTRTLPPVINMGVTCGMALFLETHLARSLCLSIFNSEYLNYCCVFWSLHNLRRFNFDNRNKRPHREYPTHLVIGNI